MSVIHPLLELIGIASLALAASYAVVALVAVLVWRTRRAPNDVLRLRPVTVLKPLCGAEPGLYEHLRSFCHQDYPEFQLVFGVLDPADPALAVVAQLRAEFPSLPIDVVVNPQQHGSNRKVSNLINMIARARHDVLAIADSDTFVGPDYLSRVTLPLQDRSLGLVTCLYRGVPTPRICSRLGAMYINDWYVPAVLVAWLFGFRGYVSGQTMCLRRDTLQAIGGLPAIANHLAEDHRLGELIRGLGMRIELSPYALNAQHDEPDLASLTRHELRWMRTLRVLRRAGFAFLFITFTLPLAVFGLLLTAPDPALSAAAWGLLLAAVVARLALPFANRLHGARPPLGELLLLPARDLLTCWTWGRSFFTTRVTWRGHEFDVGADGVMRTLSEG
jgi:ceramide glucosyltransferase